MSDDNNKIDQYKLKDELSKLNNEQYIEVYRLLQENNINYNNNKNGIFFDLGNLNDDMLNKLYEYTIFCKDNKKMLSDDR